MTLHESAISIVMPWQGLASSRLLTIARLGASASKPIPSRWTFLPASKADASTTTALHKTLARGRSRKYLHSSNTRSNELSSMSTSRVAAGKYEGPQGLPQNDYKTGPKGEPMTPIPSATLVVLCPISNGYGQNSTSASFATLVVQRSNRQGGSFRSAVVFPGGLLDQADEHAARQGGQGDEKETYLQSLQLCALRETFEETGLLLVARGGNGQYSRAIGHVEAGMSNDEWTAMRKEVHDDARAFVPFLNRIHKAIHKDQTPAILPGLAPLQHYSHWVTPRNMCRPAKRFDTHFFVTIIDEADALGPLSSAAKKKSDEKSDAAGRDVSSISADGSETTSIRLATASELMELATRDDIVLFPPQYYILADIAATVASQVQNKSTKQSLKFAALRFGRSSEEAAESLPKLPSSVPPRPDFEEVTESEPMVKTAVGASIERNRLSLVRNNNAASVGDDDKNAPVAVFPLVLPGDVLRPLRGKDYAQGRQPICLNRVYVTPRTKGEGGGLMVHGAHRRGLPGLRDFKFGTCPEEMEMAASSDDALPSTKL